MDFKCECGLVVLREKRLKKGGTRYVALNGAVAIICPGQAPKAKCSCGKTIIILKASVG